MSPAGNQKRFPLDDSGTTLSVSVWLNTPLITNSAGKLISFPTYYIRIALIAKLLFFQFFILFQMNTCLSTHLLIHPDWYEMSRNPSRSGRTLLLFSGSRGSTSCLMEAEIWLHLEPPRVQSEPYL